MQAPWSAFPATCSSRNKPQQPPSSRPLQQPGTMARLSLGSLLLVLLLAAAQAKEHSFKASVVSPEAGQWRRSKGRRLPSGL